MERWDEIRHYVRFDATDEEVLRGLHGIVEPHFDRIVEEFYDRILEHEGARRVLQEGDPQIARLKDKLRGWLESCFTGPYDEVYYQVHAKIGRVHVRIGLEPRYMVLAMHLIRWGLQSIAIQAMGHDPPRLYEAMRRIAKMCDVELAIILETYRDEYSAILKRRERLAAIGQLGASISHEVKNPLGVIASSVYALREHCRAYADEKAAKHLDRIQRNVDQANEIVTTLLTFLRTRAPAYADRDWNALVAEATQGVSLPAGVCVEYELSPNAGRAAVDPGQIGRVISNLIQNAAEAMVEGDEGVITVGTAGDPATVEVRVRDRGPGLPPDVLPQLFEPLFTTKAVGSGLGLALSKAIVETHRGTISAANAPGGGAEFRVRLPRAAPQEAPEEEGV